MNLPWFNSRTRRRARVWVVPAVYLLVAFVLGRVLPIIDASIYKDQSLFSLNTATSLLSSISSGMIAFTGFVFSMTFLLVQFGSSAYSPRLIEYFFQDPVIRHALGMFPATFVYSLIALSMVDYGGAGNVLDLTVLGALVAVLGSVIIFLALIQHVSVLQVSNVLHMIGGRGRQVIDELYPTPIAASTAGSNPGGNPTTVGSRAPELLPVTQTFVHHGEPLAVLEYDIKHLVALARSAEGVIEIHSPVGDTVSQGHVLLEVHGGKRVLDDRILRRTVAMGHQRTIEQDPKYAIRLIVDIAIRGLSPAINDPTTAVQALDQLEDLLIRLGTRQLDGGCIYDANGALRVIYPTPTWEDFLDLALDEIRYYGATSVQVMRRLRALLEDLLAAVPNERDGLVRHHLKRVNASIRRSFADIEDRLDAGQADRQGIGLSRSPDDEDIED